jgi:glutathione S-transferase
VGKLEGYLRFKGIAYELIAMTPRVRRRVIRATGAAQMPAVELPDGRFMTDTTQMIVWFEGHHPEPPVIPRDSPLGFVSRLVEDYAEELLWRPAMHYRWSYAPDREKLGRSIAEELAAEVSLPGVSSVQMHVGEGRHGTTDAILHR